MFQVSQDNNQVTQYPVITQVAEELNWKVQTSHQSGDWDIFWTDYSINPDVLIRMHLFQKINHYPGVHVIARKNLLGMGLMSMRNKFSQEYNFFPLTWMLPSQYAEFRAYYQNKQKGKCRTYIIKPQAQCQGRGIFLTRKLQDMQNGKHYVVQRYIARPYLIDGLKFDFRIYVLLCGTDPLKLFLYHQGLARFATEKYIEPCSANLDKQYMHLTNYAINKNNPNFIFNTNSSNMSIGHKRALTCVYKQLAAKGIDVETLKVKIKDMAIKTIITGLPLMGHQYKYSQPQDYAGNICFHILGLDVMLNSKGEPYLIEVNHTPSFTTDTPLDYKIKYNLIKDSLVLMNINIKKKNKLYQRCKQYNQQRLLTGKRHIFEGAQRQKMIEQSQNQRTEWQQKHLGGYQRIFPTNDQKLNKKYSQIITTAKKTYFEENSSLRMKIEQKQIKKLVRNDIKKMKESKKNEELQSPLERKNQHGTKSLPQNHQPINESNKNLNSVEKQVIKSEIQARDKHLTSKISDKLSRVVKYKHINTQMSKRTRQNELPNIQQNGKTTTHTKQKQSISQIFNRSQISQPCSKSITKKSVITINKEDIKIRQIKKKSHQLLHSQPKPANRIRESLTRELKEYSDKKNGEYVMPKIHCLNFQIDKKMDINYLAISKKIQSAHYSQE